MNMVKYCPECGMFYYIDKGRINDIPLVYDAYNTEKCAACGTPITDSELSIKEFNTMILKESGKDVLDYVLARKKVARKFFFKYVKPNLKGTVIKTLSDWIGNTQTEYKEIPEGTVLGSPCPLCGSKYTMHKDYVDGVTKLAGVCECQDCGHEFLDTATLAGRFYDSINATDLEVSKEWVDSYLSEYSSSLGY